MSYSELICVSALIKISKSKGSFVPISTLSVDKQNLVFKLFGQNSDPVKQFIRYKYFTIFEPSYAEPRGRLCCKMQLE